MGFYFVVFVAARLVAPSPGDIKVFQEKRKMKDYYNYYFQYLSLVHAIIAIIFGKLGKLFFNRQFIIGPIALYEGGFRYNQPNHLYHMGMMVHSGAYFTFDTIIELYYGTTDILMNLHHVFVLAATYFHVRNTYSGWEYMGNDLRYLN
jgi:hypothetical protein